MEPPIPEISKEEHCGVSCQGVMVVEEFQNAQIFPGAKGLTQRWSICSCILTLSTFVMSSIGSSRATKQTRWVEMRPDRCEMVAKFPTPYSSI